MILIMNMLFIVGCLIVLYIFRSNHSKHTHVGTIEITKTNDKNVVTLDLNVHPEDLLHMDKVYFDVVRV